MKLSKLINEDHPYCLWCKSLCDFECFSIRNLKSSLMIDTFNVFSCSNCLEKFEITITSNDEVLRECFTINGFFIDIFKENIFIRNALSKHETKIPLFKISFSNKDELYNKIQTYLTFS